MSPSYSRHPTPPPSFTGRCLPWSRGDYDAYLVVFKGSVGLRRGSNEPEVMVETGHYNHIELSGTSLNWPIARLPLEQKEALQK